jgi:tetratricopeptide (TPR) repeat protein
MTNTFEEAQRLLEKKDFPKCISVLTELIQENTPSPAKLYAMRGMAHLNLKQYEIAITDAHISVDYKLSLYGCEILGKSYNALGKLFDAYLWVQSALRLAPETKPIIDLKANILKQIEFWYQDAYSLRYDFIYTRSFLKFEGLRKRLTPDEYRALGYTVQSIPALCARLAAGSNELQDAIIMDVCTQNDLILDFVNFSSRIDQ